jgi:hypothetical protein
VHVITVTTLVKRSYIPMLFSFDQGNSFPSISQLCYVCLKGEYTPTLCIQDLASVQLQYCSQRIENRLCRKVGRSAKSRAV